MIHIISSYTTTVSTYFCIYSLVTMRGYVGLLLVCFASFTDSAVLKASIPGECFTGNTTIFGYEVLPGNGWDNLRNEERGRLVTFDFSTCKATGDGRYIIPDEISAIPLKASHVELYSQIIDHWTNYTSNTAATINADGSVLIDDTKINGKFSFDFQQVRYHQVDADASTLRVNARYKQYATRLQPDVTLDPAFKSRILSIAQHLKFGRKHSAKYESQLLVRDFGTHVVTSVDAGAAIVKTDHVKRSLLQDATTSKYQISLAASKDFLNIEGSAQLSPTVLAAYNTAKTHSSIFTYGGPIFKPINFSINDWVEDIGDNLVAVDRSGDPLNFIINPITLPDLPLSTVNEVANSVQTAIKTYYKYNTYRGCTDPDSPNFSYHANVDDGTCDFFGTNITFGGAYQICNVSGDVNSVCETLVTKNPMTGDFTCPEGFDTIPLYEGDVSRSETQQECSSYMIFWKHCHDNTLTGTGHYKSYWCAARGQFYVPTGYLLGGVYTDRVNNPMTQQQSCPPYFHSISIGTNLKLCVSDDYENAEKNSVPFGGLYSCQNGNPLSSNFEGASKTMQSCPVGFSSHLAGIDDECEINYCILSRSFTGVSMVPVRSPPFMHKPNDNSENVTFIISDIGQSWTKVYEVNSTFSGFNGTVDGLITNEGVNLDIQTLLSERQGNMKKGNPSNQGGDPTLLTSSVYTPESTENHGKRSGKWRHFPKEIIAVIGGSVGATLLCVLFATILISIVRRKPRGHYSKMKDEAWDHSVVNMKS